MLTLAVVDTETTGTDELDQVIEMAVVNVRPDPGLVISYSIGSDNWTATFNPTVPVTLGARATHHITDKELKSSPDFKGFLDSWGENLFEDRDDTIFVAHNAEFDHRLLSQTIRAAGLPQYDPDVILPPRFICTWKASRHVFPDCPSHSNQVLRYYLELDEKYPEMLLHAKDPDDVPYPPHRALPDALITAHLLLEMLKLKTPEELIKLSTQPFLLKECFMPKHKGKTWEEVARLDPGYMHWMLSQGPKRTGPDGKPTGFDEDTRYTLQFHLGLLKENDHA